MFSFVTFFNSLKTKSVKQKGFIFKDVFAICINIHNRDKTKGEKSSRASS